ncbi:hypothetical protein Misp01_47840 [Microtetraspora sp. NBRC 13810]|nr:hypothetical protein Misp01_47840 [Microtetraspora sp. NBRC 13810]
MWPLSGLALLGAGLPNADNTTPAPAGETATETATGVADEVGGEVAGAQDHPARVYADKWGVIGRNTIGSPSATLRFGPYGRRNPAAFAATQPPPFGVGSLGIIVGSGTEKINFGNETDFAGRRLAQIFTLGYWIFAGHNSLAGVSLPGIALEVDPNVGPSDYASLVYLPDDATAPSAPATAAPNVWQRYAASATGSAWYATGVTGSTIGCTPTTPCSFATLKSLLPNAVISLSVGITKGRDNAFIGAVDGLQINREIYDFEPFAVFRR